MIQGLSFQFEDPSNFPEHGITNGTEFFKCSLGQKEQDTVILAGLKDLVFIQCNMENVKPDPSWKTDGLCRTVKCKITLTPVEKDGKLTTEESKEHLGRYAQTNLLTKTQMKDLARKVTHHQYLDNARGKVNDISKKYLATPKHELNLGVE